MAKLMIIVGVLLIGICLGVFFVIKEMRIKNLLTSSNKLSLEIIMGYSNFELIRRLKYYYKEKARLIFLEYTDGKHLMISTAKPIKDLIKELEQKQELIINMSGKDGGLKDPINQTIYQIWLNYAYSSNYKKLFWQEITEMYSKGEISTSTYNEIYRRFYKYKYFGK